MFGNNSRNNHWYYPNVSGTDGIEVDCELLKFTCSQKRLTGACFSEIIFPKRNVQRKNWKIYCIAFPLSILRYLKIIFFTYEPENTTFLCFLKWYLGTHWFSQFLFLPFRTPYELKTGQFPLTDIGIFGRLLQQNSSLTDLTLKVPYLAHFCPFLPFLLTSKQSTIS